MDDKAINIESYRLSVCDVQSSRRNFPGYMEAQVYSLDELRGGDTSGHTETDNVTDPGRAESATTINKKARLQRDRWPNKRS